MSRNFELTPCQRKLQIFFKTKYQFPRVDLITPPEKIINELNYCGHSNERYFFIYLFIFWLFLMLSNLWVYGWNIKSSPFTCEFSNITHIHASGSKFICSLQIHIAAITYTNHLRLAPRLFSYLLRNSSAGLGYLQTDRKLYTAFWMWFVENECGTRNSRAVRGCIRTTTKIS